MLTLVAGQAESLWDEALPVEVRELPEDLAALDRAAVAIRSCLAPIVERWRREVEQTRRAVLTDGRPTIAMETYVRLMVLKQRYRWGYRTLVAEVSDSIHLRRFCRISLSERVPDESTVRKLTRRIGAETVNELTRALIVQGDAGEALSAAGGADRLDGDRGRREVSDRRGAGVARGAGAGAGGSQARGAGRRAEAAGAGSLAGDGPDGCGRSTRTIRRRSGEAKAEVLEADRADRRAAGALDHRDAGGWRRSRAGGRAGAARRRSCARRRGSRSWPIAARRSPGRSRSASRASRSQTGSCRSPTRTRGRSARASSASRTSSGTSPSWPR